jgi:hypothetical protein
VEAANPKAGAQLEELAACMFIMQVEQSRLHIDFGVLHDTAWYEHFAYKQQYGLHMDNKSIYVWHSMSLHDSTIMVIHAIYDHLPDSCYIRPH